MSPAPEPFDDLRAALLDVADCATDLAARPAIFAEASAAHRDLDCGFQIAAVPALGFQVTLKAARSLALSAEMVRGIAELLPKRNVTLCRLGLIRTAVVAAARTSYLTDPSVNTAERVRRWANMTIESWVEEANCYPPEHPERLRLVQDLREFEELAAQLGQRTIGSRERRGLVSKRTIGQPMSEMAMVRRTSESMDSHYALAVYRLTSSILHDADHGQLMHYDVTDPRPEVPLEDLVMSTHIDVRGAWLWFGHTAMCLLQATDHFMKHQGYESREDITDLMRVVGGSMRFT